MMNTVVERISRYMASTSATYRQSYVGKRVVFTTYEGKRIEGKITGWAQWYPVATFADGTWARLDTRIEILP